MCPKEARCESRGDVRAKGGQGRVPPSALPACSCGPAPPRGASAVSPLSPTTWRPSGVPFVRVTQAGGPQHLQPQRSLCDSPLLCEPGGCPAGVQAVCPGGVSSRMEARATGGHCTITPRAGLVFFPVSQSPCRGSQQGPALGDPGRDKHRGPENGTFLPAPHAERKEKRVAGFPGGWEGWRRNSRQDN